MLYTDLRQGEELRIGGIVISLVCKTGTVARLSIEADKDIEIMRLERKNVTESDYSDIIQNK